MTQIVTIAVDAMGGDSAPEIVLEGMEKTAELYPQARFLLYGDEAQIMPLLAKAPALEAKVTVSHTSEVICAEDKPSQALRRGRQSSMGLAILAVKEGEADVAVSAGNTGALMALSKFILRTMPGIDRPALVSPVPTLRGESVMLDLGANVECDAKNLVEFSIMGAAYARTVLGLSRPTVGLLNIGVEELKGREAIKSAADVLKDASDLPLDFRGFIEGCGIGEGEVDVFVTDGFTGNIALKTMEGTAKLIAGLLERAFRSSTMSKLGYAFSRSGLQSLKGHLDPNNHNGGVFLGLNGLVVKSHGGATGAGFATALSTAIDMAQYRLIDLIARDLETIGDMGGVAADGSAVK